MAALRRVSPDRATNTNGPQPGRWRTAAVVVVVRRLACRICERISLMSRFADQMKWILLVPLCLGLFGLDVLIARRALITHCNQAACDAELARLNKRFRAAQPKPNFYERADLPYF
jgi:hypothetical protein